VSRIKLKYVEQFTDRHGRPRYYFRRAGCKRTPLPGLPGSAEFMEAYQTALAGMPTPREIGATRTVRGTANAAIATFYARCNTLLDNKPITQRTDRNILEAFRAKHGDKPIALLEKKHIENILAEKSGKPAAQRNLLRVLRILLAFCVKEGLRKDNPALGIELKAPPTNGYHSWTEEDLSQYEQRHPVGSRARLALDVVVVYGTTARRHSGARAAECA
jgi:hypothetical protein